MSKRHAEEDLDAITTVDSPASKRPRVSEGTESLTSNEDHQARPKDITNGHSSSNDVTNGGTAQDAAVESADDSVGAVVDDDDERSALTSHRRQEAPAEGYTDLYLDTINRSVLDFDFEKLCSVTLSNINVYACLVCGRYYQGRGPKSHAYFHSLEVGHHVFVNMGTKRVYVLPEGYEVKSKSLEDIKFVVDPRYSKEAVAKLDTEPESSRDLAGKKYTPGSRPDDDV